MRDLIKPDPKRLVRNLSAIINFAKYREERVGVYTELTRRTVRGLARFASAGTVGTGLTCALSLPVAGRAQGAEDENSCGA